MLWSKTPNSFNTVSPWLSGVLPDLPVGCSVPQSTFSTSSVDWAKYRLRQCRQHHLICQPSDATQQLMMPKRMLDIGTMQEHGIRLVDLHETHGPYACLSYCWGQLEFVRTTSSTIEQHRAMVPWEALPLTFQHAIVFLRKLEIQFLWIDSLCIIQDDLHDWEAEARKMASVYQNADLVISATKSSNVHEGLSSDLHLRFKEYSLSVDSIDGHKEEVYFRHSFTHLPGPLDQPPPGTAPLPLISRGWAFQERLLARRILHFGPQELIWECLERTQCQCIDSDDARVDGTATASRDTTWGSQALLLKNALHMRKLTSLDEGQQRGSWHRLVEEYSKRHLTRKTDIFPALAGVTDRFQAATELTNVFGLWKETLLYDLLWHVEPHGATNKEEVRGIQRSNSCRAPTWSWASVHLPVRFINTSQGLDPCCTLLALGEVDRAGSLNGARAEYIELEGKAVAASLSYSSYQQPSSMLPHNIYRLHALQGRVHNLWADCDTSGPGKHHVAEGEEVLCFIVGRKKISGAIEALLLRRTGTVDSSTAISCERIGLLEVSGPAAQLGAWVNENAAPRVVRLV